MVRDEMIEEIFPNIYKIAIPLPNSPLKAVNSYLIKAPERFLLIDTAMNRERCRQEMYSALENLGVDLKKTDFFITHMHADHLGLVEELATDSSKVYLNQRDAAIIRYEMSGRLWPEFRAVYLENGLPEAEADEAIDNHPGRRFSVKFDMDFGSLKEGDRVEIGDYCLRVIETPGHTPGHLCLYEADRKLLFSGDHILTKITPNIASLLSGNSVSPDAGSNAGLEMSRWNSLKNYLASLEKVYALDVDLVLPGHRIMCHNLKERVVELQEHHRARIAEVTSALKEGPKTAYEVAPYVHWDIRYSSWSQFPALQKWFAVGETIAHLWYLEGNGVLRQEIRDEKALFSLV